MPDIFQYDNYRKFLGDYYQEKKRGNRPFSYQTLANCAGFKSKSFFPQVVAGKRNLSEDSIFALSKALNLNKEESTYFETLVVFNQARSHVKKQHHFQKLAELGKQDKGRQLEMDKYEYFSAWYHSTIRELVTIVDFKGDFALLGKKVRPRLSANKTRQSVELLLKLGLIRKSGGSYEQTDARLTTGDEVQSLAIENFHRQNLSLTAEAEGTIPGKEKDISCIVAGIPDKDVENIKTEIQNFRKKLITMINSAGKPDKVYHINIQFFPTSFGEAGGEQ